MNETDDHRRLAGRYRIDGVLGRGGMSEVHYGYDEHLDRPVAIKLLRPHRAVDPTAPGAQEARDALARDRERFLREIRTTARLELPGTPAVYDAGASTASDGRSELWVVMQLLRGSTLETVLDQADGEHLPIARAAAVAAQIAAVLVDVHRVDVVHRDIKPANVMIVEGGLVKVLDFGIAILHGSGALPRLTQIDRTVGTPSYMSPEQHLGRPVAAASDVYSLGCLLCELLIGEPPFLGTDDHPLRARHLQDPPTSVREPRPDVPTEIDDLVLAMLAKDAARRPCAEQVYEVLAPWCTSADIEGEQDPTRPFRRPLLALRPSGRPRPQAGPPLTADEVEALGGEASSLIVEGRPHEAVQRVETAARAGAEDAYASLRLRHCLADTLFAAGEFGRAAPMLAEVGAEYRRRLGPANPLILDCAYDAGLAYAELGEHEDALPHLRAFLGDVSDDAERQIDARASIAAMLVAAGDLEGARAELCTAREPAVQLYGAASSQVRSLDRRIVQLDEALGQD